MVDSLARGIIDGYCVGEPWNTAAVQRGIGTMLTSGYDVWNNLAEKVLGVTAQWHQEHPATHLRLRLALMEACAWLAEPDHREDAARFLSEPQYLDLPHRELIPSLSGQIQYQKDGSAIASPDFHVFGRYLSGFPWRATARELLAMSLELLGRNASDEELAAIAQQTYRTDLYRQAARHLEIPLPATDERPPAVHAQPWQLAPGIEMGADLRIGTANKPI